MINHLRVSDNFLSILRYRGISVLELQAVMNEFIQSILKNIKLPH